MWISQYFVYFIIFSFLGWIYETLYCTMKSGKWDNRGFLYGPVCPIYGMGAVLLTMAMDIFLKKFLIYDYTWWQVFLIAFWGSIILEYVTSWGLEKLFHAYWWDYSDMPFNIKGRVCLPCSLGFGCAGLLVIYILVPFVKDLTDWISPLGYEMIGLIFMCIISIDITLTVSALTHFESMVDVLNKNLNAHLEQFVATIADKRKAVPTAESLSNRKGTVVAKIAAERERFSQESMEHIFQSMGGFSKSTLYRIKGFRKPGKTDTHHAETALAQLKEYVDKKRQKNKKGSSH